MNLKEFSVVLNRDNQLGAVDTDTSAVSQAVSQAVSKAAHLKLYHRLYHN